METCTDCGERAICRYNWGTGERFGCANHDPLRPLIAAMVRAPSLYQSIPQFPVLATTGHLGVGIGGEHQNIAATPPGAVTYGITPPSAMTCTAGTGLT